MALTIKAYFIHPTMTIEQAAKEASRRHCWLKVRWTTDGGLVVVAVSRETKEQKYD